MGLTNMNTTSYKLEVHCGLSATYCRSTNVHQHSASVNGSHHVKQTKKEKLCISR